MKKADQKLLLGIAIGYAAAVVLMRQASAPAAPVLTPIRPQQSPALPQQIEAQPMTGTTPRYQRRGRAMLAALHQYNYLKQPGYPMPGWMA